MIEVKLPALNGEESAFHSAWLHGQTSCKNMRDISQGVI